MAVGSQTLACTMGYRRHANLISEAAARACGVLLLGAARRLEPQRTPFQFSPSGRARSRRHVAAQRRTNRRWTKRLRSIDPTASQIERSKAWRCHEVQVQALPLRRSLGSLGASLAVRGADHLRHNLVLPSFGRSLSFPLRPFGL